MDESKEMQPAEPEGIDWKAEARKWEAMAKKSRAAEEELEELKKTLPAELAELNAKADKAERDLEEARAQADRKKATLKISQETGAPTSLLQFCENEEDMREMAQAYEKSKPRIPAAATCWEHTRIVQDDTRPQQPRDLFAEFARQAFNR